MVLLASIPSFAAAAPVLNELAPRPGRGEGEWVEILNPDPVPVDLDGWQLRDATGVPHALGAGHRIEPGAYAVLAARPESLQKVFALPATVAVWKPEGWPVLNDRDAGRGLPADVVVLVDGTGVPVDSVAYFESWLPPEAGRSLERVDPSAPGSAAGSWGWSGDPTGGTPGRPNGLGGVDRSTAVWSGPGRVDPERTPAVFHYRVPAPGRLAVTLLDPGGRTVARLASPHPVAAAGSWVWNPGTAGAPRPGPYLLCARWEGSRVIRRCRTVWVLR
jgi:hypothetical protein